MTLRFCLFAVLTATITAFHVHQTPARTPATSRGLYATISIEESVARNIDGLNSWASDNGVLKGNGFTLSNNNGDDFSATVSEAGKQDDRVLHVPSNLIMSSSRIRQEMEGSDQVLAELAGKGFGHLAPQFFIWIKVLQEYEKGDDSAWHDWMQSLPRKFDTAVSLDEFEVVCLPPFIGSLSKIERIQLVVFRDALQTLDMVSKETKENEDLTKWAYNVVFTRCWGKDNDEYQLVPMADMFNHGHPSNVGIAYDADGSCEVFLKNDVDAGSPLRLSYGMPTNPSRFMATFGFLDESPPATFCKIMVLKPSQEIINVGYDTSRMLFYTEDGAIAEEVFDVVLYSLLEEYPEVRQIFYDAHMKGDRDTKGRVHGQFFLEVCTSLKNHVDMTLDTLAQLSDLIDSEISNYSRLPLIKKHNDLVSVTFMKVKDRLDTMVETETKRRAESA
jgi:hypothetical protein